MVLLFGSSDLKIIEIINFFQKNFRAFLAYCASKIKIQV
ncbi:hypothetical protein GXM_10261 [Nostoc sphaeroides CCNUC1]|uniref:Uncharacterized protein n=1 Tax=Nostoc sphaeroides CCNUC1 TaxID=2653204 RepID=A0A5P8WJI0_9NOSO|nr:hypothetical protein GXM_10261 [Nostoc sphaeroides CCNUC1]